MAQGSTRGIPIDTDITLAANSDLVVPSQKAVKAYISGVIVSSFNANIPVKLSGGKTLGRYITGDTIPSNGLSAQQVIALLAQEPIAPTVTLTSSTTIAFNQTAISNVLNFSYTINSLGASVSSVSLQWNRNGSAPYGTNGAWVVLSTDTSLTTFTHSITDSAFNTNPFNYRYIVTDSSLASTTSTTKTITPAAYLAPSITFSAPSANTLSSPETNTYREIGHTSSILQGSCSRNSANVNILSYEYSVSLNGGSTWASITGSNALGTTGGTFGNVTNTPATSTTTSIIFRVQVTDTYTTTPATYSITLASLIFYGDISTVTTINSTSIRALPYKRFVTDGSPFIFSTGTTNTRLIVAMINTYGVTSAIDTSVNAPVDFTTDVRSVSVNDAAGNARSYQAFVNTFATPYNPADIIQINYS